MVSNCPSFAVPAPLPPSRSASHLLPFRPSSRSACPARLTAQLSEQKAAPASPKGKRIPTFRKLQTRHRVGPKAFRQRQASEKQASEKQAPKKPSSSPKPAPRRIPLSKLAVGTRVKGSVRNLVRHGAYIDIGAKRDGLVHVRDMCIDFVHHVDDVLRPGDAVVAWIKYVDPANSVLGLTMVPPPFGFKSRVPVSRIQVGKRYHGAVQRVTNFGAYVDIGAERMAFLHFSAMWGPHPRHTLDFMRLGQKLWVAVDDVDEERSHIRLTARAVDGLQLDDRNPIGEAATVSTLEVPSLSDVVDDSDHHADIRALALQRPGQELKVRDESDEDDEDDEDDDVGEDESEIVDYQEDEEEDGDEDEEGEEDEDEDGDEYEDEFDDEFDFANESNVDVVGDTRSSLEEIAHMVDEDTEFVGLDAKDLAVLESLKEKLKGEE